MSSLPVRIAPSILPADFARLGEEVRAIDMAGCDWVHIDVMDGHFVPNITMGPVVVKAVRAVTGKPLDVHLMIEPAEPHIEAFAGAGADTITVHAEAGPNLDRLLQSIRAAGKKAGVAINPATPVEHIADVIDHIDLVLVMSVNPGFGGQSFIEHALDKVRQAAILIGDRPIELEIDGGIDAQTAARAGAAGANVLVAGTSVFGGNNPQTYASRIRAIREAAESARGAS